MSHVDIVLPDNIITSDILYVCVIFEVSRILLTFPHAENICEINPSHMVFMICNFAQYI